MATDQRGFSSVEAVIAAALTLVVMAAAFSLVQPSQGHFAVQPEAIDMQQRLRVAAGTLHQDLLLAGAGTALGPNKGSLGYYFAPVVPHRRGTNRDDPAGTFATDAVTLMFVPSTVAQATLAVPGPNTVSAVIGLNSEPSCPVSDLRCGFRRGMTIVLYDASGPYDTFVVTDAQDNLLEVQRTGGSLTYDNYAPNTTTVAQVVNVVYSLKNDSASDSYQLMVNDGGGGNDVPVVDHLVALQFKYYGEPNPPALTGKALSDPIGPWTTYGPAPPPIDRQIPTGGYPAGENCTFAVDPFSGTHVPRLATLGSGGPGGALVPLAAAELTDGPWCPDQTNVNRWDADLLRVRKIGVTLRVQAANRAMRGPAGILFSHAGTSTGGHRWLPDRQVRFDVTPRNLMLGR
jgi:hypothetical protein